MLFAPEEIFENQTPQRPGLDTTGLDQLVQVYFQASTMLICSPYALFRATPDTTPHSWPLPPPPHPTPHPTPALARPRPCQTSVKAIQGDLFAQFPALTD